MRKMQALAFIMSFAMTATVWADNLYLRDGSRHTGRFVSGSGSRIVFEENGGARRTYTLGEVSSLEFTEGRSAMDSRVDGRGGDSREARMVPAGAEIVVRTNETIESNRAADSRTFSASVDRDVLDRNGTTVVPRGSEALLVVRDANPGGATGSAELVLDLESLRIHGQRYLVSAASVTQSNGQGLGANSRTGKMVGGGAALGTILGAIAGGGKGAAIGAVAGAAAGAGAQILTRGKEVKVPAESQLTFRLGNAVQLVPTR